MEKFVIEYESLNFFKNKKVLQGIQDLEVTWGSLIWAAITIGRASWSDIKAITDFEKEIVYRKALLDMAITRKVMNNISNNRLYMSKVVESMDPSEKGGINYSLGLTFSKLFSSRLLKTHWLMHLDKYEKSLTPIYKINGVSSSKTIRPDLVGIMAGNIKDDTGNLCITSKYLAMEVKGRSIKSTSVLNTAKIKQLGNLSTIKGFNPLKVAFMSYFTSGKKELKVIWEDPEFVNKNNVHSLVIDDQRFLQVYYENFIKLIYQSSYETFYFRGMEFHLVKLSNNFVVGLNASISMFNESENKWMLSDLNIEEKRFSDSNYEENINGIIYYLGEDGVLIGYKHN